MNIQPGFSLSNNLWQLQQSVVKLFGELSVSNFNKPHEHNKVNYVRHQGTSASRATNRDRVNLHDLNPIFALDV